MLMMEVLAVLGHTNGGESFFVEGSVIASAQKTVAAKDESRLKLRQILLRGSPQIARELPRWRIVLQPEITKTIQILSLERRRNSLREDAHRVFALKRVSRRSVAADDIVVQRALNLPALFACHLREVLRAVEPLLFSSDGEKNDGRRKFVFAQDTRAFDAHRRSAGVIIGARRRIFRV